MDWPSVLVQIPLVAAFIWFAIATQKANQASMDVRDKSFSDALAKRDEGYEQRNKAIVDAMIASTEQMNELTKSMVMHDSWTRESVHLMFDRTNDRTARNDRNEAR